MKTGVSLAGVKIESMSWLADIDSTEADIADLYESLAP